MQNQTQKSRPDNDIPGKYIAGVAIAIHQELTQRISTIKRIDERIMTITLDHEHTHTPITLLVTYAPHQGYNKQEKTKHWELVEQTLNDIPKHHMTIWGEDANGQLGRDTARPELYNKIVGPYTNKECPEKGNGIKFIQQCLQHQMIPMNTWERAKLTNKKNTNKKSTSPRNHKNEINKNKTITWASPDGKTTRQIDYLMINHRYRNAIRKQELYQDGKQTVHNNNME